MKTFSKNSLRQKMSKGAMMIIILLQTACATQFPINGRETSYWNAPDKARTGARIVLLLNNQQKMTGRLLSVRDSALVVSTNKEQDNYSETQTAGILVVKNQDIQRVIIKGKSRILKGMKLGLQTGAKGGFEANDDSPCSEASPLTPCYGAALKPVIGGIVFGGAGMIMGGIVGAAVSKADKAIDPANNHDFSALKPYAQFPEKEPEYLSAVK